MRGLLLASAVWALAGASAIAQPALEVVYADDFEKGMDHWEPMDEGSFEIAEVKNSAGETTHALRALGTSKYAPKYRSPPNIALLKDVAVGDFQLTAKTQSTRPDAGPHRDMCIVWGYQDPDHFYYVHFGAQSDPHACQIFVVDAAERTAITVKTAKGTPWTNNWHEVKVTRNLADGTMAVYFDDMDEPFMTAKDDRFKAGRIGLGTFDDHGHWDDVEIKGVRAAAPAAPPASAAPAADGAPAAAAAPAAR